jgi:transmembrane sensor
MTPDDAVPWQMLERYLAGELTPVEHDAVHRWLEADPSHKAILDAARQARAAASSPPPEWDIDRMWRGVARETARAGDAVAGVDSRRRHWRWAVRVAAALVVAIGGGLVWRAVPHTDTYTAAAGQRSTVTLADGTVVTLAPATRLRVAFRESRREVALDGEAFFAVVHDARRPFTVRAGNAVATDIGTRFAVRRYAEDTAVQVVVADGAVSFSDTASRGGGRLVLGAGMRGVVGRAGATAVTTGVDVATALAWTNGTLTFDRAPLRLVVAELGRWYDVDVELADSAIGERLVTTSLKDETLPEALTALSASLRLDAVRRGRVVILSGARR